tara:strand:- start:532 stop:789 length:258 start_codon:yes stop_codon:yes gene_type:complete
MSAPNKKPTMMEMKNAVTNVIRHVDQLYQYVQSLDLTLSEYIKFKSDETKFNDHCKNIVEKQKKEDTKDELVLSNERSSTTDENL